MDPWELLERLRQIGERHGLAGFGVASAKPFPEVRAEMARRLDSGEAGRARFTYRDHESATDVAETYPWAHRLVVGSVSYLPAAGTPGQPQPNTGRIARFATQDHYQPLRTALEAVAEALRAADHRAEVFVDDGRLVDRAAAVRAGVAWWGKSTMALAPRYGPWLLLGSVVTDASLPASEPMVRDCGTCTACIPACLTGALDTEGVLDATRCISYWAQTPGPIPDAVRDAWGDRFYGCDDCLDACPPGQHLAGESSVAEGRVDLLGVLTATDEALLERFAHFYVPRRDARFLRRNAVLALGHSGTAEAIPALAEYEASDSRELSGLASWAIGRIRTSAGTSGSGTLPRHE